METEELMLESYKFLTEVQKKFPKRNYLATVVSLEGVAIFVSRYIKPLKPPEEILAGGQVITSTCLLICDLFMLCTIFKIFVTVY